MKGICIIADCGKTLHRGRFYCCNECRYKGKVGYRHKPETIAKMKEKRKLQVYSEETKRKITNSLMGRKDSFETRRKKSEARIGAKNPAWKGGTSADKKTRYTTFEYKIWRSEVFERDKYTCQMPGCGQWGGRLEANHIKLWSECPELRLVVSNGITLCAPCHKGIRQKEHKYEELFIQINKSK